MIKNQFESADDIPVLDMKQVEEKSRLFIQEEHVWHELVNGRGETTEFAVEMLHMENPQYLSTVVHRNEGKYPEKWTGINEYSLDISENTPPNGAVFRYFKCPNCKSNRRRLYLSRKRLLCRKCLGLRYRSQTSQTSQTNQKYHDAFRLLTEATKTIDKFGSYSEEAYDSVHEYIFAFDELIEYQFRNMRHDQVLNILSMASLYGSYIHPPKT